VAAELAQVAVVVELVVVELVVVAQVAVALVPELAVVEQQLHHIKVLSSQPRLHLHHPHVPEYLCDLDLQEVL
jgi:hypothetical protein